MAQPTREDSRQRPLALRSPPPPPRPDRHAHGIAAPSGRRHRQDDRRRPREGRRELVREPRFPPPGHGPRAGPLRPSVPRSREEQRPMGSRRPSDDCRRAGFTEIHLPRRTGREAHGHRSPSDQRIRAGLALELFPLGLDARRRALPTRLCGQALRQPRSPSPPPPQGPARAIPHAGLRHPMAPAPPAHDGLT